MAAHGFLVVLTKALSLGTGSGQYLERLSKFYTVLACLELPALSLLVT